MRERLSAAEAEISKLQQLLEHADKEMKSLCTQTELRVQTEVTRREVTELQYRREKQELETKLQEMRKELDTKLDESLEIFEIMKSRLRYNATAMRDEMDCQLGDFKRKLLENYQELAEHCDEHIGSLLSGYPVKELIKIIKAAARTDNGKHFAQPLSEVIPRHGGVYAKIHTDQIDLGMMERKLRDGVYATIEDLKSDLQLLENNLKLLENNEQTFWTVMNDRIVFAQETRASILEKISRIKPVSGLTL